MANGNDNTGADSGLSAAAGSVLDELRQISAALTGHALYSYYRKNPVAIGPMTSEIAEAMFWSVSKTYGHLQRLHEKGIIEKEATRGGVTRWYFPSPNDKDRQPASE